MKTIRKTIKWVLILLLAGAATAGGYGFYLWNHSDELLKRTLLDRVHEIAPGWDVSISRAHFDLLGRIHVHDLSLKDSDGIAPLLDVPEAILIIDREHLADPQSPMRNVRWIRPRLHLERDAQGVWNFRKLPPLNLPKTNAVPEFHSERMNVTVVFGDAPSGKNRPTTLEDVNVRLIPSAARQYLVKASAKFPQAEGISAEGTWQIDAGTFDLKGQVRNLSIDGALSQLAAEFSPEYRAGLTRVEGLLDKLRPGGPDGAAERASGFPAPQMTAADPLARMQLSAVGDVQFRLTQWSPGAEREYKVSFHIARGEMKNPPVPYPLQDLQGKILLENTQILLRDFSARSGMTQITLEQGRVQEKGELRPADFDFQINALPLDDRLPGLLPPAMKRVFDDVRPTGEVDVHLSLEYNGHDRWEHECDLVARNGTVSHRRFEYPIDHVEGTIQQRGDIVDVVMQGRAGTQRVNLVGRVKNPGDEAASEFVVKTAGIPLDDRLRGHCPDKFKKVIDELRAQGELDGTVRFKRAAGPRQPVSIIVDARFRSGTMNCLRFPYPLSGVSGEFHGSGDEWTFENFTGRHGPAEVSCRGAFRPNRQGRLELELEFSLLGAMFDRQLLAALPEDARNMWREFNPEGGLNVGGTILWSPDFGGRLRVAELEAELIDAKLTLAKFPFPITDIAARISYDGTKATIESFSGRHDETTIRIVDGFASYDSDGEWRVRLDPLHINDLDANSSFRKALPQQLLRIVDALNPRGKQSISGMLEFRGNCGGDYPVTAAWDTETVYCGTTINAGVDLRDMHGRVFFRGTWDGKEAVGKGQIELESVKIFDNPPFLLTNVRGPVTIKGTRLVLGSPPPEGKPRADEPDPLQRISARFIEGLLALDAVVDLGETMHYRVWMNLKDGDLKRYAQLYLSPGNNKLAGTMNGKIELKGEKADPRRLTGTGNLVISPAALYDLPVIVKIFNAVQFIPPDKKAFDQALFVFDIRDSIVNFGHIDLNGDAIKLVGRGTVNFDGKVALLFHSRMGKRQVPIPILNQLINEVSKGWVQVNVTGTLKTPETVIRAFPLPEAFKPRNPQRR